MQTQLANHVAAMAPAVVIGVMCGLLAIAFTVINIKVARLRNRLLQVRLAYRKAAHLFDQVSHITLALNPSAVSHERGMLHSSTRSSNGWFACLTAERHQDAFRLPAVDFAVIQAAQQLSSRAERGQEQLCNAATRLVCRMEMPPASVVRATTLGSRPGQCSLTWVACACLQGRTAWRIAEPCILIGLFVTLGMLLPLAFPCTPTHCVIHPGDTTPTCPPGESQHMQYAPPLMCTSYMICMVHHVLGNMQWQTPCT